MENLKKNLEERIREKRRIPEHQEVYRIEPSTIKITSITIPRYSMKSYIPYKHLELTRQSRKNSKKECSMFNYCILSVSISFVLGLLIGIILMSTTQKQMYRELNQKSEESKFEDKIINSLNTLNRIENLSVSAKNVKYFSAVTFTKDHDKYTKEIYPKDLTEDMKNLLKDNKSERHVNRAVNKTYVPNGWTVLYDNIFWGPEVENSMPQGYGENSVDFWEKYVDQGEIVKMENGCGRMQNRLVTFQDGIQACVRYRQNTDQIQGEIFSFYAGKLLNLTNLAPSVVKIVDLKDKLWKNVANDIVAAQWNTNRAVVLTQFIPSLESATIPETFKPANRHLNKLDILQISMKSNDKNKDFLLAKLKIKNNSKAEEKSFDHVDLKLNKKTVELFVELAQWSDLIIFDYLTANLDRIVNNLFNFQWNVNIMDGPAHNLAKKMDSGLLMFLDNESGLLHGYRLLKKYNVYHSLMLDNLCVFRKTTVNALNRLLNQNVGTILSQMFHTKNNAVIRDILPPLPEKNAKILHDRIAKVLSQVEKCKDLFSTKR